MCTSHPDLVSLDFMPSLYSHSNFAFTCTCRVKYQPGMIRRDFSQLCLYIKVHCSSIQVYSYHSVRSSNQNGTSAKMNCLDTRINWLASLPQHRAYCLYCLSVHATYTARSRSLCSDQCRRLFAHKPGWMILLSILSTLQTAFSQLQPSYTVDWCILWFLIFNVHVQMQVKKSKSRKNKPIGCNGLASAHKERDCIKSRRDKIGITRHIMMLQVLHVRG